MMKFIQVQKFCDDSTMHGFKEMYNSKKLMWKIVWLLLIIGSCIITVYQIFLQCSTYYKQPTTVTFYPLKDETVRVDIDMCFDITYCIAFLNFDLDSVSYDEDFKTALFKFFDKLTSPLGWRKLYGNSSFDYDEYIKKKNFTNEYMFFSKTFMRSIPNVITNVEDIEQRKITFGERQICYTLFINSSKQVIQLELLNDNGIVKGDVHINWKQFSPSGEKSFNYDLYLLLYQGFGSNGSFGYDTEENPAITLGMGNIQPFAINFGKNYFLDLNINKFVRLNKANYPCSQDKYIFSKLLEENADSNNLNFVCNNLCRYKKFTNDTSCIRHGNFHSGVGIQTDNNLFVRVWEYHAKVECTIVYLQDIYDASCEQACPLPCETWIYSLSKETRLAPAGELMLSHASSISINLPNAFAILVMEEIEAYSWTDLISNVGGLLGLWLGASLLSFLQMIYLCFCDGDSTVEQTLVAEQKVHSVA